MASCARHVRVTGRVQGVFFRQSTVDKARELHIAGWVRNSQDGSVEVYIQGEDAAVSEMLRWLHRGPPSARVSEVEVRPAAPQDMKKFELRP
jgi:acylphosphatase